MGSRRPSGVLHETRGRDSGSGPPEPKGGARIARTGGTKSRRRLKKRKTRTSSAGLDGNPRGGPQGLVGGQREGGRSKGAQNWIKVLGREGRGRRVHALLSNPSLPPSDFPLLPSLSLPRGPRYCARAHHFLKGIGAFKKNFFWARVAPFKTSMRAQHRLGKAGIKSNEEKRPAKIKKG